MNDLDWPPVEPDPSAIERGPKRCKRHQWREAMDIGSLHDVGYRCIRCPAVITDSGRRRGKTSRNRGNAFEREVAAKLGGRRVGQFGDKVDVDVPGWLRVQCKNGTAYPKSIDGWLRAIPAQADILRAVVIGDAPGAGHSRRAIIVLDFDDFVAWYGAARKGSRGMSTTQDDLEARLDAINQRVNGGIGEGSLAAAKWRDALIEVGSMLDDLINDDELERLRSVRDGGISEERLAAALANALVYVTQSGGGGITLLLRETARNLLAALPRRDASEGGDDLGAAWREAEAALPEGWWVQLDRTIGEGSRAQAGQPIWSPEYQSFTAHGPTPGAALRSLTAALNRRQDDPVKETT